MILSTWLLNSQINWFFECKKIRQSIVCGIGFFNDALMRAKPLKLKYNCFICIFLKNQAIPRPIIIQNTNDHSALSRSDLLIISASIANLWVYWVDFVWFE